MGNYPISYATQLQYPVENIEVKEEENVKPKTYVGTESSYSASENIKNDSENAKSSLKPRLNCYGIALGGLAVLGLLFAGGKGIHYLFKNSKTIFSKLKAGETAMCEKVYNFFTRKRKPLSLGKKMGSIFTKMRLFEDTMCKKVYKFFTRK